MAPAIVCYVLPETRTGKCPRPQYRVQRILQPCQPLLHRACYCPPECPTFLSIPLPPFPLPPLSPISKPPLLILPYLSFTLSSCNRGRPWTTASRPVSDTEKHE